MPNKRRRMGTDPLTWIMENGKTDFSPARKEPMDVERQPPDVLRVHERPLSQILADYFLCRRCQTVGRGHQSPDERARCPGCDEEITDAEFYFKRPIHALIDLMQDTYQSTSLTARGPNADIPQLDTGHSLALLLLFCQLFEIVQEHVLRHVMSAFRIPEHVANRLLADNRDPRRRVIHVFPMVTGEGWRQAIEDLTGRHRVDYVETLRFLKRVVDLRGALAVKTDLGVFDDAMGKGCMVRLGPMLGLHVALHNRYVPPRAAHKKTRV